MTQQDMAGQLNVATSTIRNWKNDKKRLYEIVIKGYLYCFCFRCVCLVCLATK
jgi:DNA-binding XRE family transcriptional regulator